MTAAAAAAAAMAVVDSEQVDDDAAEDEAEDDEDEDDDEDEEEEDEAAEALVYAIAAYGISIIASSTMRLLDGDKPVVSVSHTMIGRRKICFFFCLCFCLCFWPAEEVCVGLDVVLSFPELFFRDVVVGVTGLDLFCLALLVFDDGVSFNLVFFTGLGFRVVAAPEGVVLLALRVRCCCCGG